MSTTHAQPVTRQIAGPAIGTAIATFVALLWATYVNTPWKANSRDWGIDTESGPVELLWIVGFVALSVGVVYGVVVRRALAGDPDRAARTALILAVIGAPLTVLAFWSGLPIVLGIAAVHLGADSRTRLGRTTATVAVAVALGVLVAASAFYFCITG